MEKANSNKILKIRKCIAELSELYENQEAVKEICENSEKNKQNIVDWSYIMHTVHKLLLNEANRLAVKDNCNKTVAERQATCAVVLNTVRHAFVGIKPLLKCTDLIPLIFQVLETKQYEHYQETYLAILVTYVLPNRSYHIDILLDQWKELVKLCVKLYKNGSALVNKRSILEALQMSIEYGCLHTDLILDVKKLLPHLETIFLDAKANQDALLESTFKLAYTIFIQIGTECRIAICQFSEKILPHIISLNGSIDKYKLILLLVQIHHPKGISSIEDGAYAHDWTTWNTILKSIYFMIMRDCKSDLLPRTFVQLASEVLKQVFDNPACISESELFNESSYSQPAKRRRLKATSLIDMIIDSSPEEAWPIVQILTVLVEKYPQCIKLQDLGAILGIITNLLTQSCKNELIMSHLYELTAVLMDNESLFSKSLTHTEETRLQWCKIWDILLRSLSMNQCEIKGHLLVQCFIVNNKITNPNTLLRLYLTKIIKWSPMSLRTLMLFCEHISLPEDAAMFNINTDTYPTDSIKLCLLEWILNIPWNKMAIEVPIDSLCLILINIISNVWLKETINRTYKIENTSLKKDEWCDCSEAKMHDNTNFSLLQHIEHCYLPLSCKTNLIRKQTKANTTPDAKSNKNALYIQHLLDYILKNLSNVVQETSAIDDLCIPLIKITVIGRLASMLKQLNMNSDDGVIAGMMQTMREYFNISSNIIVNIDPARTKYSYLLNITKALNILYGTSYTADTAKVIISCSTSDMLKSIFDLMNVKDNDTLDFCENSDYYNDYSAFQGRRRRSDRQQIKRNTCSFCKEGIIRIQATKALTLFSCMNIGMSKSEVQIILLKHLLTVDMYDVTSMVDFKMAMIVLESLANYNKGEISQAYSDIPVEFVSKLYKKCYKDEKAVRYILNILPYSFKYAIQSYNDSEDIINIVSHIHNYLHSKNCGSLVHMEFMKCLLHILQINPSLLCKDKPFTRIVPFAEIISIYLNSSICALRFKALYCVKTLYSMENVDLKWKEMFFEKLEQTIISMFTIDRKVEEFEKADEKETRIFSALLVFAAIICNNGTLQNRALLSMLYISVDKRINIQILQRVLNAVMNQTNDEGLIEDNLKYVLSHWLNSRYTLKMFPWNLLNCTSEEQFYEKYINTLTLIKVQNLKIVEAVELCNARGMHFNKVFEEIFPEVLSSLLCSLCDDHKNNPDTVKLINNLLYNLLRNQDEFISIKKFSKLLKENFVETIIAFIQRLHDEEFLESILEYSLKEEIEHFLDAASDKNIDYSVEDLSHLKLQLSARKRELQNILVKLTGSANDKISMEAAKCLGELGPADLTTMVLYLGKSYVKEISDLFEILSYKIVIELIDLLIHNNIELRKASSNALHTVLSSAWGQKLTNRNYVKRLQTMLEEPEPTMFIDYIKPFVGSTIQNILRDTYLKIGDPDAIYGCGLSYLVDPSSRIQHYKHTRKWDRVMLAQDIELSCGNSTAVREMANALHQSGLEYLLGHFVSTLSKDSTTVDNNIQYECAWRLSNWNLRKTNDEVRLKYQSDARSEITEIDYHFYHYQALKNFCEKNQMGVKIAVENARTSIIKALKNISLECSKTVYEKLTQLQMLREIEEFNLTNQENYKEILDKWEQHNITKSNEFEYIEPILTQRTVMYQMKNTSVGDTITEHTLANTYLEIAKVAAKQGYSQVASRALGALAKQEKLPLDIKDQLQYQESLLSWIRNDMEIGRFLLRNLINKKSLDLSLRVKALRVYGDWMAKTKSENPQAVIRKYYEESINISNKNSLQEESNIIKNRYQTQVALARFADTQFEQISSYMKSPQFESLKECVNYSLSEVNVDSNSKDFDLKRATIFKQRQSSNDIAELENIKKEKNNYLILALKYYLMTLQGSEDYNLLIFRLIALWLDNMYHEEVNALLQNSLDNIPSYKFIPLIPQLAAHMSHNPDEFSGKIYKIMERCALEHPHHTLPVLMALKNLHEDKEYDTEKKVVNTKDEPRVLGAKKLLKYLSTTKVNPVIQEMDKLSHALIMLAYLSTNKTKFGKSCTIPQGQNILKIRNFENVLVPTITINVRPSAIYDNIVGVAKYVASYQIVGGINAPKKLTCIGTDGSYRYQLVKGKDDLRQDAVMQQVFTVMNTLLKTCKETKRRKLNIRTYKVVPLTERSGVLEWCNNTIPIITAIIGPDFNSGIHSKYYPNDCNAQYCKDKITAVSKASNDIKLKVFLECCANMHPAFHHFFMEKYPSPETWFERRLAYTRSIATTSMVGYILGLGDRHLNNILIDQETAEVIHIDFGIAFEQGKVLPIPETVPFRLTRNIEVAMGVAGVEGIMRRCCEETLMVLRDQKQIIITLLQDMLRIIK
ncbi:hypothetical protein KM043_014186 [Ampulex compressa]|nr:hypothetical protein KM043_014186 [Ampulex compressa]